MSDKDDIWDILESKEYIKDEDDIITLISSDGKKIDFIEIADIVFKGSFYAILQPTKLLDGLNEKKALVFSVLRDKSGQYKYVIETDDEIINAVFDEYNILFDDNK